MFGRKRRNEHVVVGTHFGITTPEGRDLERAAPRHFAPLHQPQSRTEAFAEGKDGGSETAEWVNDNG